MDTEIKLKGDKDQSNKILWIKIKHINLNDSTGHLLKWCWTKKPRTFFRSGGSSGTIAKAMSAYDKELHVILFMAL
jgi:hypothetical protein